MAQTHRRQVEWDQILDEMDHTIRAKWLALAPNLARLAKTASPAERAGRIEKVVAQALRETLAALATALSQGRAAGAAALAQSIPQAILPELLGLLNPPNPDRLTEDLILSNDLELVTPGSPTWQNTMTPEQAKARIAQIVLPPLDPITLARTWTEWPTGTRALPLEYRLSSRLWATGAKQQITSELTTGLASGGNVEGLTKRIRGAVSTAAWKARRIARTEGRRALERDHLTRTITELGDLVEGIMYQAVLDDRTRPEHAALHGFIYRRRDDGTFRADDGSIAPELPSAPNCRCSYVPVLREPKLSSAGRVAYETATERLVPDLPTYQQVWQQASRSTKRRILGAKRYDTMETRFGSADPSLAISPQGRLISVQEMQRESIDEAYFRRSFLMTRRGLFDPDRIDSSAVGTANNALTVDRVLARQDLPRRGSESYADYLARRVPVPNEPTPKNLTEAIRATVRAWAELDAQAPSPRSREAMLGHIWSMLGRSQPAQPQRFRVTGRMSRASSETIRRGIELVARLVPDRELPMGNIRISPGIRGSYNNVTDTISLSSSTSLSTVVHELLHRVDWHYTQYHFGDEFARGMADRVIEARMGRSKEQYQVPKNGKPGLYFYQRRQYGALKGLEFITTMAEQLIDNPALVVEGDPEGLELWIRTLQQLR